MNTAVFVFGSANQSKYFSQTAWHTGTQNVKPTSLVDLHFRLYSAYTFVPTTVRQILI
ncbi:MAG: hypothetical protein NWP52_01515 [Flavobacteriaceae bacterium]|nr:hypothetical protein [Flavobacteriaceae bacterium]MDP4674233.1 hypothetical protein [Flavobacteriaceae bacterium]MDP4754086.1 hypothetical protein [Flavobacteriaceae bacterium]MDP4794075.1 hypothetical protein [Flavobacteriaceae bacterium]MDP4885485.1 hypothetical protein [Flavobacteriaceae bacterium]